MSHGAVFMIIFGLILIWNTAENYVFRRRPWFGKKGKFESLGWL